MAENSGLTVEVNVECSEAIKGLKAIQREARETTKSLRELEGNGFVWDSDGLYVAKGSINIERPDGFKYITESSFHTFKHESKYVVIDLGEPTGNQLTMKLDGFKQIHRVYQTDKV